MDHQECFGLSLVGRRHRLYNRRPVLGGQVPCVHVGLYPEGVRRLDGEGGSGGDAGYDVGRQGEVWNVG